MENFRWGVHSGSCQRLGWCPGVRVIYGGLVGLQYTGTLPTVHRYVLIIKVTDKSISSYYQFDSLLYSLCSTFCLMAYKSSKQLSKYSTLT